MTLRSIIARMLLVALMLSVPWTAIAQDGNPKIEYKFIPQQDAPPPTTVTTESVTEETEDNAVDTIDSTIDNAEQSDAQGQGAQAQTDEEELLFEDIPEEDKMEDMPFVRLRSLDKITARTVTFEAKVGSTINFGTIFIKVQSCRKATPIEEPESAAFLQIWQGADEWIFSGWMYASSPGLSYMDHPVYDVWVLDCLAEKTKEPEAAKEDAEQAKDGEGEVDKDKEIKKPDEKKALEQPTAE